MGNEITEIKYIDVSTPTTSDFNVLKDIEAAKDFSWENTITLPADPILFKNDFMIDSSKLIELE